MGEITAPVSYQKLTLDFNGTLKKECFTGSDRKIRLVEIRKNVLNDHEKLGLVRDHSEAHYRALTYEALEIRLKKIGEFKEKPDSGMTREELVSSLSFSYLQKVSSRFHGQFLLYFYMSDVRYNNYRTARKMGEKLSDFSNVPNVKGLLIK